MSTREILQRLSGKTPIPNHLAGPPPPISPGRRPKSGQGPGRAADAPTAPEIFYVDARGDEERREERPDEREKPPPSPSGPSPPAPFGAKEKDKKDEKKGGGISFSFPFFGKRRDKDKDKDA